MAIVSRNRPELGDIPLAVVYLIDQVVADILIGEVERLKERPACGDDAKLVIEHQKWVADGIDDGMRERGRVPGWRRAASPASR